MLYFDIIINTYSDEYLFIYTIRCVSKVYVNFLYFKQIFVLYVCLRLYLRTGLVLKKRTKNSWVKNRRCSMIV